MLDLLFLCSNAILFSLLLLNSLSFFHSFFSTFSSDISCFWLCTKQSLFTFLIVCNVPLISVMILYFISIYFMKLPAQFSWSSVVFCFLPKILIVFWVLNSLRPFKIALSIFRLETSSQNFYLLGNKHFQVYILICNIAYLFPYFFLVYLYRSYVGSFLVTTSLWDKFLQDQISGGREYK